MYLCLCNSLKEAEVAQAAACGRVTTNPKEAYARLGKTPQCGVCLCYARAMLRERLESGNPVAA
ncbi:MAG: bacterioferritin-associated ferredoxin [Rhodothalassiaceae bacterium]